MCNMSSAAQLQIQTNSKKVSSNIYRLNIKKVSFGFSTWSKEVKLGAKRTFKTKRSKSGHCLSVKRQKKGAI